METATAPSASGPRSTDPSEGTFEGIAVRRGPGGGLAGASTLPAAATHFHAATLPELGDVVLAVTREFDTSSAAPARIELRAFAASAPGRGNLATVPASELLDSPGAVAFAALDLPAVDADGQEGSATLAMCVVTDAAPTAQAARGVADWLRGTWEVELAFGAWPAVRGSLDAFARPGGAVADWATEWLVASEHRIDGDRFLKVLGAAFLDEAQEGGDEAADGDTTPAAEAEAGEGDASTDDANEGATDGGDEANAEAAGGSDQ